MQNETDKNHDSLKNENVPIDVQGGQEEAEEEGLSEGTPPVKPHSELKTLLPMLLFLVFIILGAGFFVLFKTESGTQENLVDLNESSSVGMQNEARDDTDSTQELDDKEVEQVEDFSTSIETEEVAEEPQNPSKEAPIATTPEETTDPFADYLRVTLRDNVFLDDMENKAICLEEFEDIKVEVPRALKSLTLIVVPESINSKPSMLHKFVVYSDRVDKTEIMTYRWRVGEVSENSPEIIAGDAYRFQVQGYATQKTLFNETGALGGFRHVTEPFRILDCGI